MIDLYAWRTGNGRKPIIALEELGLEHRIHPINVWERGGREMPEYLEIHPVGQVPAMIDSDGPGGKPIKLIESVCILMYLAEKTGKLLPADPAARWEVMQWTIFHAASSVPVLDQLYWFINHAPEQPPFVIEHFREESENRLGVLDRLLEGREWLVGEYSIADIAHYSPINSMEWFKMDIDISKFPNLSAWRDRMTARPAVARAMSFLPEPA